MRACSTLSARSCVSGGGDLIGTGIIESGRTDFSAAITDVLRISDSTARHHRLESILGTKLQFEPRRRNDIEFIFAPAQANIERLLRPQLRFHYAGDIPTYATSDAFEPDVRANEDLDGLMFPDMPWMLGGDLAEAVRAATREAWPTGGPYRGRLFAFGFDAFRLVQALRHDGVTGNISVDGLTGHLSLDAERRVRRELGWAELHNGELRLIAGGGAVTNTDVDSATAKRTACRGARCRIPARRGLRDPAVQLPPPRRRARHRCAPCRRVGGRRGAHAR